MDAHKLTARVRADGTVEWPDPPDDLPPGEVEIIFRYSSEPSSPHSESGNGQPDLATDWPRLKGGRWKGDSLRRSDFYGDQGR